jgi:hypothetical protein
MRADAHQCGFTVVAYELVATIWLCLVKALFVLGKPASRTPLGSETRQELHPSDRRIATEDMLWFQHLLPPFAKI